MTAKTVTHTPGPWTHKPNKYGWLIQGETLDGEGRDYLVADIANFNMKPCNEANARLIAAAPQMLEVLEGAAMECGLEAIAASNRDDVAMLRAWSSLQNALDWAIRSAKGEL